jgi:esterase/lipase superfamily enzyme
VQIGNSLRDSGRLAGALLTAGIPTANAVSNVVGRGSMTWLIRVAIIGFTAVILGGCASGPSPSAMMPVSQLAAGATPVTIFVATTREKSAGDTPTMFSGARSREANFADITVSVPPAHKSGEIEWPSSTADPRVSFTTVSRDFINEQSFMDGVRKAVAKRPKADRSILVFIHGYNTKFEEAVFRFAQIVHDSDFKGVPVLFTWPSKGQLLDYPYDRESAVYSRDDLEAMLTALATKSGANQVDVLAHSMGNFLFVETLRQARIRGNGTFNGKLGSIMLAAPDIDIDVFRKQLLVIGRLERPMTVFVSKDDKALKFSSFFWSSQSRAGATSVSDPEVIRKLEQQNIHVVDITKVAGQDSLNHGKFASSPEVVQLIGRQLAEGGGIPTRGAGLGEGLVVLGGALGQTVGAAAGVALALPAGVAGGIAQAGPAPPRE